MNEHRHSVAEGMIPIVASSDENYARHMGVMFVSLLENANQPERFHLFVIDGGIRAQTREIIEQEVNKRKGTVSFLKIDDSIYKDYPLRRGMTAAAYYRISIPELFAESVSKIIYLDCDLIVKDDIGKLWEFPLDGYHTAAVQNVSNSAHITSGLPQHKYFNSGVMLIDLQRWRADNTADKVREFKIRHPEKIQTNDQCALNGILFDSWKRLPLRWNQQSGIYRSSQSRLQHFTKEEIQEAVWNPGIIHYIGSAKPWKYPCFHPLAEEYRRSLSRTPWAGAEPEGKTMGAFFSWSLKPKMLQKYIRQQRWQRRYAKAASSAA